MRLGRATASSAPIRGPRAEHLVPTPGDQIAMSLVGSRVAAPGLVRRRIKPTNGMKSRRDKDDQVDGSSGPVQPKQEKVQQKKKQK